MQYSILITLVSDLHQEFHTSTEELLGTMKFERLPSTEICVLAGDIGYPLTRKGRKLSIDKKFVSLLQQFKKRYWTVLFVPGNHEYYQAQELKINDIDTIDQLMRQACQEIGVIFLNCNSWIDPLNKIEFIGCTLWSLISSKTWKQMNDSHVFKDMNSYISKHVDHVGWLTKTLEQKTKYPRIIITHHLPSFEMVHPKFRYSDINDGFYSNMEHLLKKKDEYKISAWLCGHSHEKRSKIICGVPVHCNPLGYPGETTSFGHESLCIKLDLDSESSQSVLL